MRWTTQGTSSPITTHSRGSGNRLGTARAPGSLLTPTASRQMPRPCSRTWFPAHPSSKQVNAPALLMPPVLPPALLPAHGLIKTHHQPTMIQAVQANLGHCLCTCLLTHPNSKQVDARTLLAVLRVPSKVGVHCREGRLRVLLRRKGDARAAVGAVLPRYKRTCMAVPQRAEVVRCISG